MIHAIAAHRGHGTVIIKVFSGVPENFSCFEVQIATDIGGPYTKYNNYQFFSDIGFLNNVPLETTIYMQIRYMTSIKEVNTYSEWVQVKRGVLSKPSVIMECKTIKNSRIAQGAAFPNRFRDTELIAFTTPIELVIR